MRTFEWSQSLMIGHERIDSDHRVLIKLMGDIEENLESGCDADSLQDLFRQFLGFLCAHCAYEEDLMHRLPPLYNLRVSEHCHNHALLIAEARAVAKLLTPGMPCGEVLQTFQKTVIAMTRDLILDDAELVGILLLEERTVQPL